MKTLARTLTAALFFSTVAVAAPPATTKVPTQPGDQPAVKVVKPVKVAKPPKSTIVSPRDVKVIKPKIQPKVDPGAPGSAPLSPKPSK